MREKNVEIIRIQLILAITYIIQYTYQRWKKNVRA